MSALPSQHVPRRVPSARATVHMLGTCWGEWALPPGSDIRLPWVLLAIQRQRSGRLNGLELVLVGVGHDETWRAVRVDLPFPHDIRPLSPEAQELALRELPECATICITDGFFHEPQQVDVWVLTEGTPIIGRLGHPAAEAVTALLAPLGYDMEHI